MGKQNQKFSIKKQAKSFRYAYEGLKVLISEEHNARIHFMVSVCVVGAAMFLDVSKLEWAALILCIGFVFALELINSAIENLADFVEPRKNELIKKVKDLSAAAVLVGSLTSAVVGLLIILPKLIAAIA